MTDQSTVTYAAIADTEGPEGLTDSPHADDLYGSQALDGTEALAGRKLGSGIGRQWLSRMAPALERDNPLSEA